MSTGKKNAQRLGRIFRKNTMKLSTRDWRQHNASSSGASTAVAEDAAVEASFGITMATLKKIADRLTEEEKARALLGEEPVPQSELQLKKRLERFGTATTAVSSSSTAVDAAAPVVDPEVLKRRQERFGATTAATATNAVTVQEISEAMKRRIERFGGAQQQQQTVAAVAPAVKLSPEDEAALARRAARFAAPAPSA